MTRVRLAWQSEEKAIGFGKATSAAGKSGMGEAFLGLATGKTLWESDIGPAHKRLEEAKAKGLAARRLALEGSNFRPYGILSVVDGVLLVTDWAGGLLGLDPAGGKTLWHAGGKERFLSDFSAPCPAREGGAACKMVIIREKDGTVLKSQNVDANQFYLWGDRVVAVSDLQHRPRPANPEIWQLYTTDPADFRRLGEGWHVNNPQKPVHTATGGYELPVYEAFADGLMFCRVMGGIRCYDLRR